MATDRSYPAHPVIGAGCVVWRDGKILLIKRGKEPAYGTWSLPGGAQELGETIRQTAVREVLEETGCKVANLQLINVLDSLVHDDTGKVQHHYTLVDFEADWTSGDPRPGPDELDAAFFSPAEIETLGLAQWTLDFIRQSVARRAAKA